MLESYYKYILAPLQQATIRGWICLSLLVVAAIVYDRWSKRIGRRNIVMSALGFYLGIVFWITVLGRSKVDVTPYEVVPFWSWKAVVSEIIETGSSLIAWQILLNVILFVPIGILVYWLRKDNLRKTILWCVGFSLFIELLQLVFCIGLFEWDDILHNTLGYVLGLWIGCVSEKVWLYFKQNNDKMK